MYDLTWKLVFRIYASEQEKQLELTRYKLNNITNVKTFLKEFFEEQREWLREENRSGKGLGYEIVLVDEKGDARYWRDVGKLEAYFESNMDLVAACPLLNLYDPE